MSLMGTLSGRIQDAVESMRSQAVELNQTATELEEAWAAWDLDALGRILQLSEREVEDLREELDETEMEEEDW